MEAIVFYLFAGAVITGSLAVITLRNPIASGLALIFTLFITAGLFVLLQAHFMAVIQVLVYVGAIMVLFLFVFMLVELKWEKIKITRPMWLWGGLTGSATLFFLIKVCALIFLQRTPAASTLPKDFGTIEKIGELMFSDYIVGFELISVLLLIALLGAVFLTQHTGERT